MKLIPVRYTLLVVLFLASASGFADQKIKTKSNIKNDRLAESPSSTPCPEQKASERCADSQCAEASGTAVDCTPAQAGTASSQAKPEEPVKAEGKGNP